MGTNQSLTTKQVTVLTMLKELENYVFFEEILEDFSWDSIGVKPDEEDEIFEILQHYGYIGSDRMLTLDGKQYLYLLKEYVEKKAESPAVELNTSFTLINIEKLGLNIDILPEINEVFKGVKEFGVLLKNVVRILKSTKQ